ncbi:MAG: hydroxymethylbilane synthase [Nitrospinota bacterium]
MTLNRLKIGTRKSPLALWQAEWVKATLLASGDVESVELVKIVTSGDKILDVPLAQVGGTGLFTKEIEESLLNGGTDLAVHSLKDVPTLLPDGLKVDIISERENPFDALISRGVPFDDLPQGAKIGTSSLRRRSQLKKARPDFEIVDIRGNVGTRLNKLDTENLDAVILAAAGMIRMGHEKAVTHLLPPEISIPAVGQGALGIEIREGDTEIEEILRKNLHHQPTALCTTAERSFLTKLEGGCQVPLGAFAQINNNSLEIEGFVADLDGVRYLRDKRSGAPDDAENLGRELAETLLAAGADKILAEFYGKGS